MNSTSFDLEKLKFPIGSFQKPDLIAKNDLENWIAAIETFPATIKKLTENLSVNELNWIYRPNGWTIKQVVHHCADSHINSFVRFKLALTEEMPVIKPYEEDKWAELNDGITDDLSASIQIIEGIHARWILLLKSFGEQELKRQFIHPANNKTSTLEETIGVYAWHCNHHLAHIEQALFYKGNF
ncbi:MAG: YfiT family bacillithiol transferase [Flavobacterium sp.]